MAQPSTRRAFLASTAAGLLTPLLPRIALPAPPAAHTLRMAPEREFSFAALIERARQLAQEPYRVPPRPAPELVRSIDYDVHGQIKFRTDLSLYRSGGSLYPVTFFHLGALFPKKVTMNRLDHGLAAEIIYSPSYFDMPEASVARQLPDNAGFAGFRLQEARDEKHWRTHDWAAFLGASYFRAIGDLGQYGISARGIAIDTATSRREEFPDFVEFYIGGTESSQSPVEVFALLDGPSIAGAYRFDLWRSDGVVMDVEKHLFLRRDVLRLGIAPLTSMFWYAEHSHNNAVGWRPEVHDSDGLTLWTNRGERIWRPLNNPPEVAVSSFLGKDIRSFGLLQRDRNFDHYLDGVRYDKRPSLWVEPLADWGDGSVQLVEIPTRHEYDDNIVAFWVPQEEARAGHSYVFRYRLYWQARQPYPPIGLGKCVATRRDRSRAKGGAPIAASTRYMVEFAGGPLDMLSRDTEVEAVLTATHGTIVEIVTEQTPSTRRWRTLFDLTSDAFGPIELRVFLRLGDKPLTETWLFQHHTLSAM